MLRQILLFIIGLDHDGNVPVKTLIIYAVIPFFIFLSLFCFIIFYIRREVNVDYNFI